MVRGLRIEMRNMKLFTTIKIGYSAGVYGCSGEYFTTIYTNGSHAESFHFSGMYGAEERVNSTMRDKGYKECYTPSFFGRVTRSDIPSKAFMSEQTAIKYIKRGFRKSKKELAIEEKAHNKLMKQIMATI